jgi:hypothetical protein
MRKRLAILFLLGIFAFPSSAHGQESIKFTSLQVQLLPEYDQPSMLVIYDFKLPDGTKLPVNVSVGMPKDANLVAVASLNTDESYINTDFVGPTDNADRQIVTIQIQKQVMYHLEYYEPLSKSEGRRDFTYLWGGDYPVNDLNITIRVPLDTNSMVTTPVMSSAQNADGADLLTKDFGSWGAGQQLVLQLNYIKTSDQLIISPQNVQPSQPITSNTPGRLILANYLPYVFGALGLALIGGGVLFFWQSSRGGKTTGHKRSRSRTGSEKESAVYCSQCGARARTGDHFCRVCGTKLRLES